VYEINTWGDSMKHIHVVDDEEATRRSLRLMLKRHGYSVSVSTDGKEALDFIAQGTGSVDLLITDINMPKLNGLDLLRELDRKAIRLPFLVMSGGTDDRQRLGSGLEVLSKPLVETNVLDGIQKAFASQ